MTDKALQQGGQVVRVTTKAHSGATPVTELYDAAIADPRAAEHAVSEHIKAIDEMIEAVEPLSQSVIDALGLKPGEVRRRT
jgi:hypothetical protein